MDLVTAPGLSTDAGAPPPAPRHADVLTLFAVTWAVANLFHVVGRSARAIDVVDHRSTVALLHVALGIAGVALLARPRSIPRLLVLAALGPISAWFEAPLLGSHW